MWETEHNCIQLGKMIKIDGKSVVDIRSRIAQAKQDIKRILVISLIRLG